MNGPPSSLVRAAVSQDDADATDAWRTWRMAVDIQQLTWPELQTVPVLPGLRLQEWLAGDPAAAVLKGIVRRSWSEAQVRLAMVQQAAHALTRAGCDSVTVVGSAGQYLRTLGSDRVRPIPEIRLLVRRAELAIAAAALQAEGWEMECALPLGEALDWSTNIPSTRNGVKLYLHWRVLRIPASDATACETEFLSQHSIVEALGAAFRILAPGHALLEALAERHESTDVAPWQADAAMIARQEIDWALWAPAARKYLPQVIERLSELRAMGLDLPSLPEPPVQAEKVWRRGSAWAGVAGRFARRMRAAIGGK
jgi:hypothetical protein